ncbi:cilia- and flagella-associated protein 46 [Bufo gargarizans]|uniref:cilia- and flagella-associated protein 46 n=1 Tax=Bufo gargarizans TaxID=30331 RepID=UPI001CF15D02|nr:cilia- and flagella-associated protein 46 [Bufo gargarizans]
MDPIIRQHLSAAENQQDADALLKAYTLIKAANRDASTKDGPEKFSSDLYILCAEQALQLGSPAVSKACLQMYFKSQPPPNQFLGRAFLCQAQLHSPKSPNNLGDLEKSVAYYLKTVDFAKQQERYHFLVYNASVLYLQTVRPFLKPGSRHLLIPSLVNIVKSLGDIDDADNDWRADLMLELLECFLDAQKMKEAADFATMASEFFKVNAPQKYPVLFAKMVHHKLIDSAKAAKETKSSATLSVLYKIQKLRSQMDGSFTAKDVFTNLNEIYKLLAPAADEPALHLSTSEKIPLLIELARLSMDLKCNQLAAACIEDLKNADISDPKTLITLECLHSDLQILNLGRQIDTYNKSVVEAQLSVINRLETTLQNAVRLREPNAIQEVCTTLWDLCLPLLQPNLRKYLKKPFISMADSLENIDSLLTVMRCQIHLEIAQLEEEDDRIEAAIRHLEKALSLDGNGQYQSHLKCYLHRLQLRTTLYTKPQRAEDQAAMILEQAKQSNAKDSVRKKRPLLVNAGLCLAPDVFQMVLDSENEAKISTGKGNKGHISYLCMKAQHHSKCVQKTDGHLKRMGNANDAERVRLWADLAKLARKQEVWDVCRAACRFCLLYDDGRWSISKLDVSHNKSPAPSAVDEGRNSESDSSKPILELFSDEKVLLRLLAEIRFINAEATIHFLKSEGCKLNETPIPPEDNSTRPSSYIPVKLDEDPDWILYRDWISQLSSYATENFLQAAELGVEMQEAWITHNATVYILNHNQHIIASGRLTLLLETLKKLLVALKKTGHCGNAALLVMLSNALAKGLILRWIPVSDSNKRSDTSLHTEKGKKAPGKGPEKSNGAHVLSLDPNGLPDVKLALEVCDYALDLTHESSPKELVPISLRQQLISTWVKAKQLLQQQIGPKLGTDDEENNEGQNLMTKVIVTLEMHSCNGLGLMDFTVPSLSQVWKMAQECDWSDPLVELQALTRLAHFAYSAHDLELALSCTRRALTDERIKKQDYRSSPLAYEMLSVTACIQGQSIMDSLAGKKHLRLSAIKAFEMGSRFAGEAGSPALTLQAARHFWYASSPLIKSATERDSLKDSVICVIKALAQAEIKNKKRSENDTMLFHLWPSMDVQSRTVHDPENLEGSSSESDPYDQELSLKAALYELLFHMYADKKDWQSGLKVLDEAISILPRTRHRLILFKHRVLVKARLGQNFFMDIQKFKDESEDYVSYIWHHVALACKDTRDQLACYMNAVDALKRPENDWQKVEYLLELAEWLYSKQFPVGTAVNLLDWAVDILLHMKFSEEDKSQKAKAKTKKKSSPNKDPGQDEDVNVDSGTPGIGENAASAYSSLEDLRNVRQLEALARAFMLMAVISGGASHEQHCLMAFACVLRIWQVALPAAGNFIKSLPKKTAPVQNPQSASSRKEKGKKEANESVVTKEKTKRKAPIDTLPSTVEEWAGFDCPDEVRDAFRQDTSCHVINRSTIVKPTYSLYYLDLLVKELQSISFTALSLPVLHLAEVIAHDVVQSKSLSDLYHLRISQVCTNLKLYCAVSYHQRAAGNVFITEYEQISCRQEICALKNEKQDDNNMTGNIENASVSGRQKMLSIPADGTGLSGCSLPYLWLEKADVLIDLGFFHPARVLLTQAYKSLQDMGDGHYLLKCLYLLSVLAVSEKNYGQAKSLLMEVKDLPRDAELWYKTSITLTEAVLGAKKEGGGKKAVKLLETTIDVFRNMMQKETNREPDYGLLIAKLHARKFAILLKNAQALMCKGSEPSQVVVVLLDMCDKMSQTEADLLRYGHKEYRAEFMMEHANILRILGCSVEDLGRKHGYYLDAYVMAEKAISAVEQILYNIQRSAVIEAGGISLPVQRKLVKMKLDFAELSLEIVQLVIKEEGEKLEEEKRKGELRVIVEEFVRATPDCNSVEQEWKTLGRTVASAALAQLANALTLASGCNDLKAEALYIAGKCLRSLSFRMDPLHPDAYWNNDRYLDERKACEASGDNDTERHDASMEPSSKRPDQLALKTRRKLAQMYLAQSTEILLQAISVAINNRSMNILSSASLEICTCLGQFDPCTAGVFLALHQSCVSSVMTEELLLAATLNTSNSQFAALLHLLQYLQKRGDEGPLRKQAEQRLAATSTVWRNLQVTMQFFNIFNELPPNFNLVILQHSEDRSLLYGALLEKPKPVSSQKGKPSHQQKTLQAKVARCSVDRQMFTSLLEKMELFKQDMMQSVLKKEHQESFTRREINRDPAMNDPSTEDGERRQRLAEDFHEIVEALENYLSPVLLQLDFSPFRQPSPPLSVAGSVRVKSRERDDKPVTTSSASVDVGDCTILLADKSLQQLPLEALGILKDDSINALSRDFSLQLLYNRIHRDHTEDTEGKRDVKSAKESKQRGEQKKIIKTVPVNRVLPANCMPVDTHRFKYIVDPYNDIREPEALSPVYRMNELLVKYSQQFAANWEGITGASHVPSHAEWESLMTSCSAFIFYGTERLLAHVLLDKFLAMDFTGCQLMILLDQVRTSHSFSRQSMIDIQKSESLLWLERPVETALMLSAAGVRSMMLNQWHTPLQQNAKRLELLSEYLLALGKTTGQAVHSQRKLGSDSDRKVREDHSEDTHNEAGQSPRDSKLLFGDPSPYSYILYGLPNMVVM